MAGAVAAGAAGVFAGAAVAVVVADVDADADVEAHVAAELASIGGSAVVAEAFVAPVAAWSVVAGATGAAFAARGAANATPVSAAMGTTNLIIFVSISAPFACVSG